MTPDSVEFKAIDELTEQTDYTSLCECALRWLRSLESDIEVELYEAYDIRGHMPWEKTELENLVVRRFPHPSGVARPSWLGAAYGETKTSPEVQILDWPQDGSTTYIFCVGAVAEVRRFVVARSEQASPALRASITCIVSIFSHQIALIDRFERDTLTGLLNRQSFDYRLDEIIERHRQNPKREIKSSLPWLAIADIDHFKRINDTYGHLFGDEILLLFSQLTRKAFRFDDLLFRYGGEEFVVILHNTDAEGAANALARFRKTVEANDFPTVGKVTASIGWAGIRPEHIATHIIHNADKALYYAKGKGRNRIASYEEIFGVSGDGISEKLVDIAPPAVNRAPSEGGLPV